MTAQIQTSRAYTRSLLQSQEEMKEIYKKRNGLLEELQVLIASHERQKALHLIEDIGTALNKTKRRQYCQNTLVNAALATYLTRAEELKIPVTATSSCLRKEPAQLGHGHRPFEPHRKCHSRQ